MVECFVFLRPLGPPTSGGSSQYLTFTLDKEHYAVDIAKVREVLEFTSVNKVPRTPEFMRGMINLRGNIVPVIDLRLKLGSRIVAMSFCEPRSW